MAFSRQRHYRAWVKDKLQRPALALDGLGYRVSAQLPGHRLPVHIIGLNTAWLCGDDADKGHLLLTENQLGIHLTTDSGDELPGLRIVLMHHPLSDLADAGSSKRLLATHADLVLRGHLHETEVVEWIDPDRRLRELAAGSLYEGGLADTYGNSCHFVRLDLDSKLRPIEALVRFRSFSSRGGHWFDDSGLYSQSKNGRLAWKFHHALPNKANPYSPWTPRAELCFGRANTLRQLEAAFDERRSIWLTGDWRIGKTTILLAWEKRLRERGITARLVSGQGAAGISVADFVQSVTGLDSPSDPDDAANRLKTWIETISRSGLPPVVLVDEVESIVQTCDVRFFERLRDLLGSICLVFSSREAPDDHFINTRQIKLPFLDQATSIELLTEPSADFPSGAIPPDVALEVFRRTAGQPFLLQIFGYLLVEHLNTEKRQIASLAHLDAIQTRAIDWAEPYFRDMHKDAPPETRDALAHLARGETVIFTPRTRRWLTQRYLLTPENTLAIPLFASWIEHYAAV